MIYVFLVRHGQASAGTDNYDRLSEIGKEQSQLLGEFWKLNNMHFDAAFSGSLQRQQHTAQIALSNLPNSPQVETLEGLNEYDHHTVDELYGQGLLTDDGMSLRFDQYVEIMQRWRDAPESDDTPFWNAFARAGWDTINGVISAQRNALAAGQQKNIVFFTSGGVISTIFAELLSSTFHVTLQSLWQTRNSSSTQIIFDEQGAALVDYNTIAHLQTAGRSELITQI